MPDTERRSDATPTTEITLASGLQLSVAGSFRDVEAAIVGAARGAMMDFAWLDDAVTGQPIGINPDHVQTLRAQQR